ncbi:Ornithine decarboxylase [Trichinella sp. T9]|nr:Ornithine decarboxylase [Trichinella sp. T9]
MENYRRDLSVKMMMFRELVKSDIANGQEKNPIPAYNRYGSNPPNLENFVYSRSGKVEPNLPLLSWGKLQGCKCKNGCSAKSRCPCILENKTKKPAIGLDLRLRSAYFRQGLRVRDFNIRECGPACACDMTCPNKQSQKPTTKKFYIEMTAAKGWGLFADSYLLPRTFICEYAGVLRVHDSDENAPANPYCMQVISKTDDMHGIYVDSQNFGNFSRFINHSCAPNAFAVPVLVEYEDLKLARTCIFALRPIQQDHEITIDYSYTFWNTKNAPLPFFDGHAGTHCARTVASRLYDYMALPLLPEKLIREVSQGFHLPLVKMLNTSSNYVLNVRQAFKWAFKALDDDLCEEAMQMHSGSPDLSALRCVLAGSCACVAYVKGQDMYIVQVGDSGAVLGVSTDEAHWTARKLNEDHTADNQKEVNRIRSEHPPGEALTVLRCERLLGELYPLRAFGDVRYKWPLKQQKEIIEPYIKLRRPPMNYLTPPYLTCEPSVYYYRLTEDDKFLILASDGLWEMVVPEAAVRFVANHAIGVETLTPYQRLPDATLRQILEDLRDRKRRESKRPVDVNSATHLIRHALTSDVSDENVYAALSATLSIPECAARAYRDDITVTVVYFHQIQMKHHVTAISHWTIIDDAVRDFNQFSQLASTNGRPAGRPFKFKYFQLLTRALTYKHTSYGFRQRLLMASLLDFYSWNVHSLRLYRYKCAPLNPVHWKECWLLLQNDGTVLWYNDKQFSAVKGQVNLRSAELHFGQRALNEPSLHPPRAFTGHQDQFCYFALVDSGPGGAVGRRMEQWFVAKHRLDLVAFMCAIARIFKVGTEFHVFVDSSFISSTTCASDRFNNPASCCFSGPSSDDDPLVVPCKLDSGDMYNQLKSIVGRKAEQQQIPNEPPTEEHVSKANCLVGFDIAVTTPLLLNNQPAVTCEEDDSEEAFFLFDLGKLIRLHQRWIEHLPQIHPFYAVKCNDNKLLLSLLASMGVNFDCASKNEIETVLSIGVSPERIIFANPCKPRSAIEYANSQNVRYMTFDNEQELQKIHSLYPKSELLMRISTFNYNAVISFEKKFGCNPITEAPELLKKAIVLGCKVVGIWSGCRESSAYTNSIANARKLFDLGNQFGCPLKLLDIGGGFSAVHENGALPFESLAMEINQALSFYFPSDMNVTVIAEPGRYYAAKPFQLCTRVIAADDADIGFMYFINDGIYGSFNCILTENTVPQGQLLKKRKASKTYWSTVWGQTCDSLDIILKKCQLPELFENELLLFQNMGAYSLTVSTEFNGFSRTKVYPYIKEDDVDSFQPLFLNKANQWNSQ